MILPKTIQEITDAARVEEVVGDFVTLKRRGSNLIGLCPFHNEKSPSFNVNPARNIFKCFGCGEGGDPLTFIMKHESIGYPEALRFLAKKYGIAIEETAVTQEYLAEKQVTDSLYIVNERALKFFQDQLFETDKGKSIGLAYFKERGFREETIRKWGLGFTTDDSNLLTKTLITEGYALEYLRRLGLTSKEYERDFFRNRVMFTIQSLSGKPIAFAGRIMQKDANAPKYINSPETEIYIKSRSLYGIFHARKAIQQTDECILVEGYTDVISLHQAGIENVVASSGTSLTTDQIRMIKRFTPNIKILYDGDAAGIKAAVRGLDMVLEEDMNVRVVLLPNKEDPDSFVQRLGATAFQEFLNKEAKDFILFKTQSLLEEAAGDPIKKSKLIKDIVASISKIPDAIKRQLYIRECAELMKVDEGILVGETGKVIRKNLEDKKRGGYSASAGAASQSSPPNRIGGGAGGGVPGDSEWIPPAEEFGQPTDNYQAIEHVFGEKKPQTPSGGDEFQEKDIVRILVAAGGEIYDVEHNVTVGAFIISNIEEVMNEFDNKLYQRIVHEAHAMLQKNTPLSAQHFLSHSNPEFRDFATTVLFDTHDYSKNWEEKWGRALETQKIPELNFTKDSFSSLKRFKLRKIMKVCEHNQELIRKASDAGDMGTMMKHLKIHQRLMEMRTQLANELNTVVLK
jgi:DNA primase